MNSVPSRPINLPSIKGKALTRFTHSRSKTLFFEQLTDPDQTSQFTANRRLCPLPSIAMLCRLMELGAARKGSRAGHGAQKSVDCMRRSIVNNSRPSQTTYDPFSRLGYQSGRRRDDRPRLPDSARVETFRRPSCWRLPKRLLLGPDCRLGAVALPSSCPRARHTSRFHAAEW